MLNLVKKSTLSPKKIEKWVADSQNANSGPMRSTVPPDFDTFDLRTGFPTSKNVMYVIWYPLCQL